LTREQASCADRFDGPLWTYLEAIKTIATGTTTKLKAKNKMAIGIGIGV
jgi:hypothetical protein